MYREKLHGKVLYTTADDKCFKITSQGSVEVPALQYHQEEADGRLLLHAAHAAREGYQGVVICAEDTDVFILSLAFQDKIGAPLFQQCGTKTRRRVIDIRKVAAKLGTNACRALIGMHAYTGCDTVSAFAGRGKAKALKILTSSKEYQDMFLLLGQEWDLPTDLFDKLEEFTCLLYASKTSATKVNFLRYHLFCAKKGEIESHQLLDGARKRQVQTQQQNCNTDNTLEDSQNESLSSLNTSSESGDVSVTCTNKVTVSVVLINELIAITPLSIVLNI